MKTRGWQEFFRALADFSRRQRRRILLLVPLLVLLSLLFLWQGKTRFEVGFLSYGDHLLNEGNRGKTGTISDDRTKAEPRDADSLFMFDPNRVGRDDLLVLGFTEKQAQGILNYRSAGAVFRRKEDFARCYTVSERMYERLSPYIRIAGTETAKESGKQNLPTDNQPEAKNGEVADRQKESVLFIFDPNAISRDSLVMLGFTEKQAQGILNYRSAGAVFRRKEAFARCYTVSEKMYERLSPYIRIGETVSTKPGSRGRSQEGAEENDTHGSSPIVPGVGGDFTGKTGFANGKGGKSTPVDLNTADSATLVAVRGIGPLTAGRIVAYRERLGGYVRAEQLQEVEGMTEKNYRLILQQIYVDSSGIKKIDINFATPKRLKGHPYLPPKVLNRILKYRQLKGGWSSTGDLIEQHILSEEQAARLAPYLCFGTR